MAIKSGSRKGHKIQWIVIHYPVALGKSAEWLYKYYYNTTAIKSAHFAVDKSGVKQIVALDKAACRRWQNDKKNTGGTFFTLLPFTNLVKG